MNILEKIELRIAYAQQDEVRNKLIELGERGKELHRKMYDETGAYYKYSVEQWKKLYREAQTLVDEWRDFYMEYSNNDAVVVDSIFTEDAMVCNNYIMHANEFIKQ